MSVSTAITERSRIWYNNKPGTVIAVGLKQGSSFYNTSQVDATHAFVLDFFSNELLWIPIADCKLGYSSMIEEGTSESLPYSKRRKTQEADSVHSISASTAGRESPSIKRPYLIANYTSNKQDELGQSPDSSNLVHVSNYELLNNGPYQSTTPIVVSGIRRQYDADSESIDLEILKRLNHPVSGRFQSLEDIPLVEFRVKKDGRSPSRFAAIIQSIARAFHTELNCEEYADFDNWKSFSGLPDGKDKKTAYKLVGDILKIESCQVLEELSKCLGFLNLSKKEVFRHISNVPKKSMIAAFFVNPHPFNLWLFNQSRIIEDMTINELIQHLIISLKCLANPDPIKDHIAVPYESKLENGKITNVKVRQAMLLVEQAVSRVCVSMNELTEVERARFILPLKQAIGEHETTTSSSSSSTDTSDSMKE